MPPKTRKRPVKKRGKKAESEVGSDEELEAPKPTWNYDIPDLVSSPRFAHPEIIRSLHGSQVTLDFIKGGGLQTPVFMETEAGLRMGVPPRDGSFTIDSIKKAVGPNTKFDVVEVATQTSKPTTMKEFAEYFKKATSSPATNSVLYNCLSLEFTEKPLNKIVWQPDFVREIDWVNTSWPEEYRRSMKVRVPVPSPRRPPKKARRAPDPTAQDAALAAAIEDAEDSDEVRPPHSPRRPPKKARRAPDPTAQDAALAAAIEDAEDSDEVRPPHSPRRPPKKARRAPDPTAQDAALAAAIEDAEDSDEVRPPHSPRRPPKKARRAPDPTAQDAALAAAIEDAEDSDEVRPPHSPRRPPKKARRAPDPTAQDAALAAAIEDAEDSDEVRPPHSPRRPPKKARRAPDPTAQDAALAAAIEDAEDSDEVRPPHSPRRPPKKARRAPDPTAQDAALAAAIEDAEDSDEVRPPHSPRRPPKKARRAPDPTAQDAALAAAIEDAEDSDEGQLGNFKEVVDVPYPKVQHYCLMSVSDSFTDFHLDFGGTSVWYHVNKGEKIFWLVPPTTQHLKIFEEWQMSHEETTFFGDLANVCHRVVLRPGNTFLIPSGWIHAVYTPKDSLVFGGNFLHDYAIGMQLQVYDIETRTRVFKKFRYPMYMEIHWYTAARYVKMLTGRNYEIAESEDFIDHNSTFVSNKTKKLLSQFKEGDESLEENSNSLSESESYVPPALSEFRKEALLEVGRSPLLVSGLKKLVEYLGKQGRLQSGRRSIPIRLKDPEWLLRDLQVAVTNAELLRCEAKALSRAKPVAAPKEEDRSQSPELFPAMASPLPKPRTPSMLHALVQPSQPHFLGSNQIPPLPYRRVPSPQLAPTPPREEAIDNTIRSVIRGAGDPNLALVMGAYMIFEDPFFPPSQSATNQPKPPKPVRQHVPKQEVISTEKMPKPPMNPYWTFALLRRREEKKCGGYKGPFEQFRKNTVDHEWAVLTVEEKSGWKNVVNDVKKTAAFKAFSIAYYAKKKLDAERKARRKAYNKSVRGPEEEEVVSDSEDDRFMEVMSGAAGPHPYCFGDKDDKDDPHFLYRQLLNQLLDGLLETLERVGHMYKKKKN